MRDDDKKDERVDCRRLLFQRVVLLREMTRRARGVQKERETAFGSASRFLSFSKLIVCKKFKAISLRQHNIKMDGGGVSEGL